MEELIKRIENKINVFEIEKSFKPDLIIISEKDYRKFVSYLSIEFNISNNLLIEKYKGIRIISSTNINNGEIIVSKK